MFLFCCFLDLQSEIKSINKVKARFHVVCILHILVLNSVLNIQEVLFYLSIFVLK